jgi:uncharacterized membrane protein
MISKTYISAIVILLAEILPVFGVQFTNDKITDLVQAIIILVAGGIILVRRYKLGDITLAGTKIK